MPKISLLATTRTQQSSCAEDVEYPDASAQLILSDSVANIVADSNILLHRLDTDDFSIALSIIQS